jgi:altronate dehydratase small subunit
MLKATVLSQKDNVATAITDISAQTVVCLRAKEAITRVNILQDIPMGHKFAVEDIGKGENIIKYGEIIGRATKPIEVGAHVHVHNIKSLRGRGDLAQDRLRHENISF